MGRNPPPPPFHLRERPPLLSAGLDCCRPSEIMRAVDVIMDQIEAERAGRDPTRPPPPRGSAMPKPPPIVIKKG